MKKKVTYIPFGDIIVMTIEHTLLYRSQSMVFWGSRCLLSPMLYDIFSLLRSDQCMHVASQSIFHAWFRVNGQLTDRPQGGKATKIDLPIQEREHATHHSQIRAAITPTLFEACPRAEKPYRTSTHVYHVFQLYLAFLKWENTEL